MSFSVCLLHPRGCKIRRRGIQPFGFNPGADRLGRMPMDPAKLIERRTALRLTQADVAAAAGMKQQAYARLETGGRLNPRIDTVEKVARALECAVGDLLVAPKLGRRRAK